MRVFRLFCLFGLLLPFNAVQADDLVPASLYGGMGSCLTPVETYPYKLPKSDPLYETALADHQRYLEELEDYVNCLDRERSSALAELRASFDQFMSNFGKDAVLKYAAEHEAARE